MVDISKISTVNWANVSKVSNVAAANIASIFGATAPAGLEDFTTYTEDDVGGYITVAANTLTCALMPWNVDVEISKDFTANYFSADFTIRFEYEKSVDNGSYSSPFILANVVENSGYWNSNQPCIRLYHNGATGGLWVETRSTSGNNSDLSTALSLSTRYYITVVRDDDGGAGNGVVTATIRTGSHVGPTHDTISANCADQIDYRYLMPLTSHNAGGSDTMSFQVFNYELVSVA
jgi:hypothetical protein